MEVSIHIERELNVIFIELDTEPFIQILFSPVLNSCRLIDKFANIDLAYRFRRQKSKEWISGKHILGQPLVKVVALSLNDHVVHGSDIAYDRQGQLMDGTKLRLEIHPDLSVDCAILVRLHHHCHQEKLLVGIDHALAALFQTLRVLVEHFGVMTGVSVPIAHYKV